MLHAFLLSQATGLKGIADANGLGIAAVGLLIVFTALTVISLFIALMPKALAVLERVLPELDHHHGTAAAHEQKTADEELVVAAIGFVLHTEVEKASHVVR